MALLAKKLEWFDKWVEATGETEPDWEKLPSLPTLPDLLEMDNGEAVISAVQWKKRRQQIQECLEYNILGSFPAEIPEILKADVISESCGTDSVQQNLRLHFDTDPRVSLTVEMMIPKGKGPFPVLMTQSNHRAWGLLALSRGYIACIYPAADIDDQSEVFSETYPDCDWGTIARRAWSAGRVLDYLYTLPEVDRSRVGITGHSRNGKQSLIAAAIDERFTAVISSSSGSGGATPFRFVSESAFEESVEFLTRKFPDWFHPRLRFFTGREERLPMDTHGLLGLIAPRHCLLSTALNDGCETTFAIEQCYESGKKVYDFLEKPDGLEIRYRDGGHETCTEDILNYLDWLDHAFGRGGRSFEDMRIHNFDWDYWQEKTQPKAYSARETYAPDNSERRKRIIWSLGEEPPGQKNPGGSYGCEKPFQSLFFNRDQTPESIVRTTVTFGDYINGDLYFRPDVSGEMPVVIWLHPYSYSRGYSGAYTINPPVYHMLAERGCAVFAYDQLGFGRRLKGNRRFYKRYPRWSKLGKMVRDARAAVDFLSSPNEKFRYESGKSVAKQFPNIDTSRIFLLGYSLGGLVALYATALDGRVAGLASFCGFTPMRTDTDEKNTGGIRRLWELHALQPRLGLYNGREDQLPFDFEDMLALIAPRDCLLVSPIYDRETEAGCIQQCIEKAAFFWNEKSSGGNLTTLMPEDYNRFEPEQHRIFLEWLISRGYLTNDKVS